MYFYPFNIFINQYFLLLLNSLQEVGCQVLYDTSDLLLGGDAGQIKG